MRQRIQFDQGTPVPLPRSICVSLPERDWSFGDFQTEPSGDYRETKHGLPESSRPLFQNQSAVDELNLAEFPLAAISDRFLDGTKTVVLEDTVFDREQNKYFPRRLTLSGSDRYGLPTSKDDDVLLGGQLILAADGSQVTQYYVEVMHPKTEIVTDINGREEVRTVMVTMVEERIATLPPGEDISEFLSLDFGGRIIAPEPDANFDGPAEPAPGPPAPPES